MVTKFCPNCGYDLAVEKLTPESLAKMMANDREVYELQRDGQFHLAGFGSVPERVVTDDTGG